jgi:hypothetical protein
VNVDDVGRFRFCPACARPVSEPIFDGEGFLIESQRCSGCDRPWPACPCEPAAGLSKDREAK